MEPISWDALKARGQIIDLADINQDKDYFVLGHYDNRRSSYQWTDYPLYLVKAKDIVGQQQTAFYELDYAANYVINVNTPKGVIEVTNFNDNSPNPQPALATYNTIVINNTTMDYSNPDKVYLQITPYYNAAANDTFIPYILPTGFAGGSYLNVYNINPAAADINQFKGKLYIYYETYNF